MNNDDDFGDDNYPTSFKPLWNRRSAQREHEINILIAGIAGSVLTALIIFGFLHR
jgi:hypothetical protein